MTHEESWNTFIDELRTYVQEHHHGSLRQALGKLKLTTGFPNKHTRLLSKVKYTRILRQAQEPFFDKITNLLLKI